MIKTIAHLADIHIRKLHRFVEYRQVFKTLYKQLKQLKPDLIYIGGDIVHGKLDTSPEEVRMVANFFLSLCKIAPTIIIPGNHDCNLNNKSREDTLSPIVDLVQKITPNLHYWKKSGHYNIEDTDFGVMSIFDIDKDGKPDDLTKENTFKFIDVLTNIHSKNFNLHAGKKIASMYFAETLARPEYNRGQGILNAAKSNTLNKGKSNPNASAIRGAIASLVNMKNLTPSDIMNSIQLPSGRSIVEGKTKGVYKVLDYQGSTLSTFNAKNKRQMTQALEFASNLDQEYRQVFGEVEDTKPFTGDFMRFDPNENKEIPITIAKPQ